MRIIGGTYRSRQLKSLRGLALRPTSDMLRETLFNILGPRVEGSRFLDLFAGTGAVGIEAISRGAAFVVLVENHAPAVRLIRQNLASLQIAEPIRVVNTDALPAIAKIASERSAPFDFAFLDPPYANERDYHSVLHALEKSPLLVETSIVIVEHRKSFSLPATVGRLHQFRTVKQGDASLSLYQLT
jgi:16S rRNA (guanine966-N2)-methyltransferase